MIFDYLEKGYTALIRWKQGSDDTVRIRWYRAQPGAKVYTEPNAFGSTVYEQPEDIAQTGVGEIKPFRYRWFPSLPEGPPGQSTPTPADWFLRGVPADAVVGPCVHVSAGACGCGYSVASTS